MNLPNKLTMLRIGLTFFMVIMLTVPGIPFGKTLALLIFAFAGITDIWDGYLARSRNIVTSFGQLMDPLADKILVGAVFVSFVALDQIVPAWIVILIISREFAITGLRLLSARAGKVLPAGVWGKQKMIWQTILIITVLVGLSVQDEILPLFVHGKTLATVRRIFEHYFRLLTLVFSLLVALLTLVSGVVYIWQGRELYVKDL